MMARWIKRAIPITVKRYLRTAQFLLVYFGRVPAAQSVETRDDRILASILDVRRDIESHTCRVPAFPGAEAFVGRLQAIYAGQKRVQPAPAYRVGEVWGAALRTWRRNYLQALESGQADALLAVLRCFQRNDAIAAIGIEIEILRELFSKPFRSACFVTNLISKYQAFPRVCDPRFLPYVDEGDVGCPVAVRFDGQKLSPSGFRNAYYASEFSRAVDFPSRQDLVVCELGGGYGNLARILKQAHPDRRFTYVVLDLPQMLPVSAYFLRANCPDARLGLWDEIGDVPLSRSRLREYDFVLLPNWSIEALPEGGIDAVINTASLAEMDTDIVDNYLEQIRRITAPDGLFYTVNRSFGIEYPGLGGARETGMNVWNLDWPGWQKTVDRPSWADQHWGAWEQMNYRELVLERQ